MKALKETEFDQIKSLLSVGIQYKKIETLTGRSHTVIRWVKNCETWEDYKKLKDNRLSERAKSNYYQDPPKQLDGLGVVYAQIKQAFAAFIDSKMKIMGLGYDDKIYYYTPSGWKELKENE